MAQEVVDAADGAIEIPQAGTKHSVNVSVAGGVVLWNFFGKSGQSAKFAPVYRREKEEYPEVSRFEN